MTTQRRPNEPELDESVGGFAMFQARAEAREAVDAAHCRTGFHSAQRAGSEDLVVRSVLDTYERLDGGDLSRGSGLADIGAGSGALCGTFTATCAAMGCVHVVDDSEAMLAHLSPQPNRLHVSERFHDVLGDLESLPASAAALLLPMHSWLTSGEAEHICPTRADMP